MHTLDDFCRQIIDDGLSPETIDPRRTANAFVHSFGISIRPSIDELIRLLHEAGVRSVSGTPLPRGMRGIHCVGAEGFYDIRYSDDQWEGAQEHTVLHEAYEIILETVRAMRGSAPLRWSVCRDADRFAAAVLMQPGPFAAYAAATGLDIVELQRIYRRSYASVALRLTEVMRRQPLITVLYEGRLATPGTSDTSGLRASVAASTPGFSAGRSSLLTGRQGVPPWRGAALPPGSVAESAALTGRPVHAECAGEQGIALTAKPVLWSGRVAKVVLVAVPHRDRSVLMPQATRGSFERLTMHR